jgi:hypothetical protein
MVYLFYFVRDFDVVDFEFVVDDDDEFEVDLK